MHRPVLHDVHIRESCTCYSCPRIPIESSTCNAMVQRVVIYAPLFNINAGKLCSSYTSQSLKRRKGRMGADCQPSLLGRVCEGCNLVYCSGSASRRAGADESGHVLAQRPITLDSPPRSTAMSFPNSQVLPDSNGVTYVTSQRQPGLEQQLKYVLLPSLPPFHISRRFLEEESALSSTTPRPPSHSDRTGACKGTSKFPCEPNLALTTSLKVRWHERCHTSFLVAKQAIRVFSFQRCLILKPLAIGRSRCPKAALSESFETVSVVSTYLGGTYSSFCVQ